jgi:hypothetical protein
VLKTIILAATAAIGVATADHAQAAQITMGMLGGYTTYRLEGPIVSGDAQRLDHMLTEACDHSLTITCAKQREEHMNEPMWLELNSPGGNVGAAIELAEVVRRHRITTMITSNDNHYYGAGGKIIDTPNDAVCASACVLVFYAGVKRLADPKARLGVHRAADGDGHETADTLEADVELAYRLKVYGAPSPVVSAFLHTPNAGLTWVPPCFGGESTVMCAIR